MENKYKVIVSTKARMDIYHIVDYWENTLEVSADSFLDDYEKAILKLADSPLSHHQPNNEYLRVKGYRILPVKNYYIFYIVKETEVQIHRVLYSKMDFTKLF